MMVRTSLAMTIAALLAGCGGNKAGNSAGNTPAANVAAATNAAAANPEGSPENRSVAHTNAAAAADAGPVRQVMWGGDAELDLCPATAQVKAGRTAIVRAAPNDSARELARIPAGTNLRMCDVGDGVDTTGDWFGAVYQLPGDNDASCPQPRSRAERASVPAGCRSGWVKLGDDVDQVAG
jgi:hypothetical protein